MGNFVDLAGKKFGSLQVLRTEGKYKSGQYKWLCKCDCGNEVAVCSSSLVRGLTKSCGCQKGNFCRDANIKHGKSKTRLYGIWTGIKTRCFDRNCDAYIRYGGRGITMCDEWANDFQAFYKWSMDNGYAENLTIDRIDNTQGYSPSNCRWATYKEQGNNTSKNRMLTAFGETHTLTEWAERSGLLFATLRRRVFVYGWDVEKAITTPVRGRVNDS